QRTYDIGQPESAKGNQQRNSRTAGGKEYLGKCRSEEAVDEKVKPFENIANRRGNDHAGQSRRRGRAPPGRLDGHSSSPISLPVANSAPGRRQGQGGAVAIVPSVSPCLKLCRKHAGDTIASTSAYRRRLRWRRSCCCKEPI